MAIRFPPSFLEPSPVVLSAQDLPSAGGATIHQGKGIRRFSPARRRLLLLAAEKAPTTAAGPIASDRDARKSSAGHFVFFSGRRRKVLV
jgi:hypothetical protein